MKVKPFKEEVIELVLQFLQTQMGEAEIAKKLREKHIKDIPKWILTNNEMINKGITKIIKAYAQMDKKIKQYYAQRKEPAGDADDEVEAQSESGQEIKKPVKKEKKERKASVASVQSVDKKIQKKAEKTNKKVDASVTNGKDYHDNTSSWVKNKFQPPKKLEQIGKDQIPSKVLKSLAKHPKMVSKEASSEESSDRPLHSDHSESEEEIKKKNKKTETKQKEKKKENQKEKIEEKPKVKKGKKVQSSQEQEQQSQSQQKIVVKQKKAVKKQKKQQKQKQIEKTKQQKKALKSQKSQEKTHKMHTRLDDKKQDSQQEQQGNKYSNGYKKGASSSTFSRIKVDEIGPIPVMLQDNSFEAKFKYGKGGDEWGRYGHEKLKDTRGESFKKTKDKLKNKAYQGGNIDFNVINSIPIE